MTTRRTWLIGFAVCWLLGSIWAVATPLWSAPDEKDHVARAASLVRGDWLGSSVPGVPGVTVVQLPASLVDHPQLFGPCLRYRPEVTGRCITPAGPASRTIAVSTWEGRFPPAYYLLVGWPTRWWPSTAGVYATRIASAALNAALLATALLAERLLARRRRAGAPASRGGLAPLGVVVAATPMVVYLTGTVNPSSVEITAALALWTCGVALVDPGDPGERAAGERALLCWGAGVSGALLTLMRGSSPLWLLLTGVVLGLLAGPARLAELLQTRAVRRLLTGLAVAFGVAVAYATAVHANVIFPVRPVPTAGFPGRLRVSIGHVPAWLHQSIASFGWKDNPLPRPVFAVWGAAMLGLLAAALGTADRRRRVVLVALPVLTLAVSVAIEAATSRQAGYFYQGRHLLPMAVGVPVLAASALPDRWFWRHAVPPLLAAVQLVAFVWSVRRYTGGLPGPLLPLHPQWSPPVPAMLLIVGYAVLLAAAAALVARRLPAASSPAPVPHPVVREPVAR